MRKSSLKRFLRGLASLRLTLAGFVLLGAAAFATASGSPQGRWLIALPLFLLALNLLAALVVCACFRRQPSLFAFHVCLLLLAVLLGLGQLTRLTGHFEIAEGQAFDPAAVVIDTRGGLNPGLPGESSFRQGEIQVDYDPGLLRRGTSSRVWVAAEGTAQPVDVVDAKPLLVDGYRFYVTHNKGFSAVLTWQPRDAATALRGTVHFPSYPRLALSQTRQWHTPGGTLVELRIEPEPFPQGSWDLNGQRAGEGIWIRAAEGGERWLRPGEPLALPDGWLRLEGLGMWMGYRVFYDPTLPWIAACALLAVLTLGGHLWGRMESPVPKVDRLLTIERRRA
jgi:cytochrome c biogenesis protein